jgi:NarL family two-component system response regulator LiaR
VKPISVAIADDHRVVSRGLKAYLESFADLKVVGTASSGEELLAYLPQWRADVVVQDLLLPGGIDGIETTCCGGWRSAGRTPTSQRIWASARRP